MFRRLGVAIHQNRRVGVAGKIVQVDLPGLHQLMHQREDEQSIRAGCDPNPVVGHRIIAGANRD